MTEQFPDILVLENKGLPAGVTPPTGSHSDVLAASEAFAPRLGAFEVVVVSPSGALCLLFSKLLTGTWPVMTEVFSRMHTVAACLGQEPRGPLPDFYSAEALRTLQRTSPSKRAGLTPTASAASLSSRAVGTDKTPTSGERPRTGVFALQRRGAPRWRPFLIV
jgi:hypothetical protein